LRGFRNATAGAFTLALHFGQYAIAHDFRTVAGAG
jgi:hypothetical protein